MSIIYTYFSQLFCCVETDSAAASYLSESDVEDYYLQREQLLQEQTSRAILAPIPPFSANEATGRAAFFSSHNNNCGSTISSRHNRKPPCRNMGDDDNDEPFEEASDPPQDEEGNIVFDVLRTPSISTSSATSSPIVTRKSSIPPPATSQIIASSSSVATAESSSSSTAGSLQSQKIDPSKHCLEYNSSTMDSSSSSSNNSSMSAEHIDTLKIAEERTGRTTKVEEEQEQELEQTKEIEERKGTAQRAKIPTAGSTMAMFQESGIRSSSSGSSSSGNISYSFPPSSSSSLAAAAVQNTWSLCPPESFLLRVGPNYNKHKRKAPSAPALYEIVGVE